MRRLLPLVLLFLAGCGGHESGCNAVGGCGGGTTPTIGAASLDLAVSGNAAPASGVAYATAMRGTGTTQGSLAIADAEGNLRVRGEVEAEQNGGRLGQLLVLSLDHAAKLAVGTTLAVNASSGYAEETLAAGEAFDGFEGPTRFWSASGGTATVTALSGGTITLSLKDVALAGGASGVPSIALSGTITGTVASS